MYGDDSCCFADLVNSPLPLRDSTAEGVTAPKALNNDIQEAIILASGIAQACSRLSQFVLGYRQPTLACRASLPRTCRFAVTKLACMFMWE